MIPIRVENKRIWKAPPRGITRGRVVIIEVLFVALLVVEFEDEEKELLLLLILTTELELVEFVEVLEDVDTELTFDAVVEEEEDEEEEVVVEELDDDDELDIDVDVKVEEELEDEVLLLVVEGEELDEDEDDEEVSVVLLLLLGDVVVVVELDDVVVGEEEELVVVVVVVELIGVVVVVDVLVVVAVTINWKGPEEGPLSESPRYEPVIVTGDPVEVAEKLTEHDPKETLQVAPPENEPDAALQETIPLGLYPLTVAVHRLLSPIAIELGEQEIVVREEAELTVNVV